MRLDIKPARTRRPWRSSYYLFPVTYLVAAFVAGYVVGALTH